MKLSKQEQIKRIQMILGNKNIITCDDCGLQYLPLTKESEQECPVCHNLNSPALTCDDVNDTTESDDEYIKRDFERLLDRKLEV